MKKLSINIDGRELSGFAGQTILEVARENGIFIPTLCYDERTEIYGSCGLCVVEIEGNPKLWKACATEIAEGWIIKTDTERVIESRKTMLELLLSNHAGDCRPPCAQACPAHTDCQGYVGLVANGEFEAALELIKERIPLPASIGRVCPHPCEDVCRRRLVDEPIGIAWIKRFAGDADLEKHRLNDRNDAFSQESGKSVAIIGGGPYGLSLAYFLRQLGHAVTIYEMMPKAGGMLRYGIPEYRLPKTVVDQEVELIEAMGVEIITDVKVGVDVSLEAIREIYDAVALGVGAWKSTGSGAKGEGIPGVIGGIDLLRKVVRGEDVYLGKRVAVVGGGNTAMDACRTAVRLGADKVYNIYRRTRNEMPADLIEIEEALEEGVVFKNLTTPIEYSEGSDGRVAKVKLQVMELGEPDASGRRAPVAVEGKTETLEVDSVILAIGQAVDTEGFENCQLELTRKKGIVYDPDTFRTNIPGVFAGGDCGNDKISIAVEAVADAQKVTEIIDAYLAGEDIAYRPDYLVERDDITEQTFEDRERKCRPDMSMLTAEERKRSFAEVVLGWDASDALEEAARCLECGCGDYFECRLFEYANLYDVNPERFRGAYTAVDEQGKLLAPDATDDGHPFIIRESGKCILCGLCVRVCDEVMGVAALGLVERGFKAMVKPALEYPLVESGCISCGQCVSICPTGALRERLTLEKSVPLDTEITETVCSHCSIGCTLDLESYGDLLVKVDPCKDGAVNKGLICGRGKFGFDCAEFGEALYEPLIRNAVTGALEQDTWYNAFKAAGKKAQSLSAQYGEGSVALSISDRYSNEEIFAIRTLAESLKAQVFSFNNRASATDKVLGAPYSPTTLDEALAADYVLAVGIDFGANPVANIKLKQAAEAGKQVVVIAADGVKSPFAQAGPTAQSWATQILSTPNDLGLLKEIVAALLATGSQKAKGIVGYDSLVASLEQIKPSTQAQAIAQAYGAAKKAIIVYQQNILTPQAAELLCEMAVLSGHIGSPRDGIIRLAPKNNSQGLYDRGVTATAADLAAVDPPIRALLVFGEDPEAQVKAGQALGEPLPDELKAAQKLLRQAEFIAVCDTHLTLTGQLADVVLPGSGFASAMGTFTNTEGRLQLVQAVVEPLSDFQNWEIAREILTICEDGVNWADEEQLSAELSNLEPLYRETDIGEVTRYGGGEPRLFAAPTTGRLVSPLPTSDYLTRLIDDRLSV